MIPGIDTGALLRFLQTEAADAASWAERLGEARATALEFYRGEPFGDEEEGRSQLVTRDVAEVVDYMTVSVLRTMVSGDKIVEFEAADESGRQAADDATAWVQHDLMRRQRGYALLHDWLKAGLLEKSGVAKSWAEPRSERVEMDVPPETVVEADGGLALIDGTPVLALEPGEDVIDELTGAVGPIAHRVTVEQPLAPLFRDETVPNEEFLIAKDARSLDDARYLAHRPRKSVAELISMGYADATELRDDGPEGGPVARVRDGDASDVRRDGLSRIVWLHEEYPLYPVGGVERRLLVHRVGSTILHVEVADEHPFELWTPFPAAHRVIGDSLADKVMDIQRVRSVLLRQAADNLYQANAPRVLVPESDNPNTIDDLLTVRPGALIRYSGSTPPTPFAVPFAADKAFSAMEIMAGEKEARTGITRLNQGLDADTLNKTATGTALMQAQGQQIEEYIARNFAEAVARLCDRKRRLMRRYGQPAALMVNGQPRQIDPATWPDDMHVTTRVGLGTGRKDVRLQYRQLLLGVQQAAMEARAPIASYPGIYANLAGIVADMSLGSVSDFFTDPAEAPEQERQPDPETMKAHAAAMLNGERLRGEQRLAEARLALAAQESAAKVQATRDDAALKLELAREQAAEQAQLARDRAETEARLAMDKLALEERIAMARLAMERDLAERRATVTAGSDGIGGYRPGGALDE